MVLAEIRNIGKKIRDVKIQGASRITNALINGFEISVKKYRGKKQGLYRFVEENLLFLTKQRETEPDMRYHAFYFLNYLKTLSRKEKSLEKLKRKALLRAAKIRKEEKKIMEKIAKNFGKVLRGKKKYSIFTHCHSNTVENAIIKNKARIKEVFVPEARPLYQGRRTVRALSGIRGIMVWHFVDSASWLFMKKADLFITGVDAITTRGEGINKIGTYNLSLLAKKFGVGYYILTGSHKFDFEGLSGKEVEIEKRSPREVWGFRAKNLKIVNPAFDKTPSNLISGVISEYGVLRPLDFVKKMKKKY